MKTLLVFLAAVLITLSPAQATETLECGLRAGLLMQALDGTHFRTGVVILVTCTDGTEKVYRSRESKMDSTTSTEVGSKLIDAMVHEVGEQLRTDGAPISDTEITKHLQLTEIK